MDELRVDLGQRSYPIFIDQNLFPIAGQLLKGILTAGKIMVITNPTVGQLYLNDLVEGLRQGGFEVFSAEVPDGEQYKTLDSASGLYDSLLDHQMDRASAIGPGGRCDRRFGRLRVRHLQAGDLSGPGADHPVGPGGRQRGG